MSLEQKFSPKTHLVLGFVNSHVFTRFWEWGQGLGLARGNYITIQIGVVTRVSKLSPAPYSQNQVKTPLVRCRESFRTELV